MALADLGPLAQLPEICGRPHLTGVIARPMDSFLKGLDASRKRVQRHRPGDVRQFAGGFRAQKNKDAHGGHELRPVDEG